MERLQSMSFNPRWVLVGLLSTLTMDITSTLVRMTGLTSGVHPSLVGRWFASIPRGKLMHHTIAETPAVAGEMPIALVGHYLIGITLAVTFGVLLSLTGIRAGRLSGLALAVAFGVTTNLLPWLVMFPSMGFGLFGREGPPDLMLFRTSSVNHLLFGVGLAWSTYALRLFATDALG
jgi:hypothetical protein